MFTKSRVYSELSKRLRVVLPILLFGLVTIFVMYSETGNMTQALQTERRGDTIAPKLTKSSHNRVDEAYGQMEMSFEANQGQTNRSVDFVARGAGYSLFLSANEAVFSMPRIQDSDRSASVMPESVGSHAVRFNTGSAKALPDHINSSSVLRLKLNGANPAAESSGVTELEGKANYFIGSDAGRWHTDISTYRRVRYSNIYRGIDVEYYGNSRQLEFDFRIVPRADYRQISMKFEGAKSVKLEAETGDLLLDVDGQIIRQHKPVVYQEWAGEKREIESRFTVKGDGRIGFEVVHYDSSSELIIDPVLVYSSYLGGGNATVNGDKGVDIAVDSTGNTYIVGKTHSSNFPTVNPFQGSVSGDPFYGDVFVTKINAAGSAIVYSTYLGGIDSDTPSGIAVDANGNAYLTGSTGSNNFPTAFAIQGSGGGSGNTDVFLTEINATGSGIVFSTYLGGSSQDFGGGIAIDQSGNIFVVGNTLSNNFPVTPNAIQSTRKGDWDVFLTKINASGSALWYSTYIGGPSYDLGSGVAVDGSGNAYITGTVNPGFPTVNPIQATVGGGTDDAFLTKINAAGSAIIYSTYLGGNDGDSGNRVAVDQLGSAYVTGATRSTNFPTVNPIQGHGTVGSVTDCFVTKINPAGSAFVFSTYLGGNGGESGNGIALDPEGNVYVAGGTNSTNFPQVNPVQASYGGSIDSFVTKINSTGSAIVYSTYFGGGKEDQANGIAVDSVGNAYFTGATQSTNFITVNPFQSSLAGAGLPNAFVAKIADGDGPPILVSPTPTPTPRPTPTPYNGKIVISQIYGGGGTPGAVYKNSFIELFNRGNTAEFLSGLVIELATGTDDFHFSVVSSRGIALDPGQHKLIKMGSGGINGADLPPPDDDFSSSQNSFFGVTGKLFILAPSSTFLGGPCPLPNPNIVDFVGFGATNCFEGEGPRFNVSSATAAIRLNNGCIDTDNNAGDFTVGSPNPRNGSSPFSPCFPTPTPSPPGTPTPAPNTVVGTDVNVQDSSGSSTATFSGVSKAGMTTFTPISPPSSVGIPPAGYSIVDAVPGFNIATSAVYTAPVTVCIMVNSVSDPATFWKLRILHGENGGLVDRTMLSPDTPAPSFAARKICARVQTLSSFVVAMQPTATPLAISGRALSDTQIGIRSATVIVTSDTTSRRVLTNSFGLFTVDNLEPGKTYTISAVSKRYRFTSQVKQLNDNVSDIQMIGLE